jgi:V8-like Glu-specific endopeptidase
MKHDFILLLCLAPLFLSFTLEAESQPPALQLEKLKAIEATLDNKSADAIQLPPENGAAATVVIGRRSKIITNTPKILAAPTSIPITVTLASTSPTTCKVTAVTPQSTAKWHEIATQWFDKETELKTKPLSETVTDALNQIESLCAPYIESATSPEKDEALYNAYTFALESLQAAYNASIEDNDNNYRVGIASVFNRVRNELSSIYGTATFKQSGDDQKAIYGTLNNFVPDVYKQIYNHCFGAVGIVHPDKQGGAIKSLWHPNASGVLIAPNLILTCSHDITDDTLPGENLQVWFDYAKDTNGSIASKEVVEVDKILYDGRVTNIDVNTQPLDFALLELKTPVNNRQISSLTSSPVTLDTAIYVIGCPKGDYEVVHDSCHVLFPYELVKIDYDKVKLRIQASLIGKTPDSTATTEKVFKYSYEKVTLENKKEIYRYYLHSHGQHMPVMGADCDTFHGDSGGPAFLRTGSVCCGILIEGESDDSVYTVATFTHHEKLLPMRVINERLSDPKVGLKGWPKAYNISID